MKTKHNMSLIATNVLNGITRGLRTTLVVVGPNVPSLTGNSGKKWGARAAGQRGKQMAANDAIFLKDIGYAPADSDETGGGCSYRASGYFCRSYEVPTNLVPVTFDKYGGVFRDANQNALKPTHIALLPDGRVLAALPAAPAN